MKTAGFLALFLASTLTSSAAPFVLKDLATGAQYNCGPGSGTIDPVCMSRISEYCKRTTTFTPEVCFDSATGACRAGATHECVSSTADYCNRNTTLTGNACFARAIGACTGSARDIQGLADSVREYTEAKILKTKAAE